MDTLKDLIFRYCILFGRRFSAKERIAFLRVISKELLGLGYHVDAKIAKLKLAKKNYANYYNAYVGDLENADLIICTNYDTGINNYNLQKTYAFKPQYNRTSYFIGLLPVFFLFLMSVVLNYFFFLPDIQTQGFLSVSGVLSILSTLLLFYFIVKWKNGIPNKKNFVCNTSSIIILLNLIKKLDKQSKKKIAFVLVDGGNTNQYGIKMLESYSKKITKKKIIFIDSIGNDEQLQIFKSERFDTASELDCDVTFLPGKFNTEFKQYLMMTSGSLDSENNVIIKNAHSRKDSTLSLSIIDKHTESLYRLVMSLITTNK